ncbi:hypothetical protein VNO78_30584 [Psophocarpus tetragonolobus]|uniref:Uncharacterized protein n=1 Tax=Psophocarpus tetragonolobus TaxID=3891 RepID=A0AAN9RXK7_PSOTE
MMEMKQEAKSTTCTTGSVRSSCNLSEEDVEPEEGEWRHVATEDGLGAERANPKAKQHHVPRRMVRLESEDELHGGKGFDLGFIIISNGVIRRNMFFKWALVFFT